MAAISDRADVWSYPDKLQKWIRKIPANSEIPKDIYTWPWKRLFLCEKTFNVFFTRTIRHLIMQRVRDSLLIAQICQREPNTPLPMPRGAFNFVRQQQVWIYCNEALASIRSPHFASMFVAEPISIKVIFHWKIYVNLTDKKTSEMRYRHRKIKK